MKAEMIKALIAFQKELEPIKKTEDNPFFHSKYASLESILGVVTPILNKHGLIVTHVSEVLNDKNILITTLSHTSGAELESRYTINVTSTTRHQNIDYPTNKKGEKMKEDRDVLVFDPQQEAAANTYHRRQQVLNILGVTTSSDDDDGNKASRKNNPRQPSHNGYQPSTGKNWDDQYSICPKCGKKAYGKSIKGETYYCYPKQGGCGSQFPVNDRPIPHGNHEPDPRDIGKARQQQLINTGNTPLDELKSNFDELLGYCEINPDFGFTQNGLIESIKKSYNQREADSMSLKLASLDGYVQNHIDSKPPD